MLHKESVMKGRPRNRTLFRPRLALIVAGLLTMLLLELDVRHGEWPVGGIIEAYGKIPLQFEANRGQAEPRIKYILRGKGLLAFFTDAEIILQSLHQKVIRMAFGGPSRVEGIEEMLGVVNYIVGSDPKRWRTNVPTYAKVKYRNIHPGIDFIFYSRNGRLEYDLVAAPGADPTAVILS